MILSRFTAALAALLSLAAPLAAQTPGGFATSPASGVRPLTAADLNAAFGRKLDALNPVITGGVIQPDTAINVRATGSTVTRSLADRAGDVMQGADHGVVCDGTTDAGPAIQAMLAKVAPSRSAIVQLPPGVCAIGSQVAWTSAATLRGHGGGPEGTPGANGTWLKITAAEAGFILSGANVRGAAVLDLGVMQDHPASAPNWAPTPYNFVFRVMDTYGSVLFDNIMFAGINKGIYAYNSGRLRLGAVFGQFYSVGLEMDALYDVNRIDHLHCWPFRDPSGPVMTWSQNNGDCIVSRRVDGLAVGDLFAFGMRSAVQFASSTGTTAVPGGSTSAFQLSNVYADFVRFGLWVTGANTTGQVSNLVTTHTSFTALPAVARIPGSTAIRLESAGNRVAVAQARVDYPESNAFQVVGGANRLSVAQSEVYQWNSKNDGSAVVDVADGGAMGASIVQIGAPPMLTGNGPDMRLAGNASVTRNMQMNLDSANANEPRGFAGPAGSPVHFGATGADPSINLNLFAKGPEGKVSLSVDGAAFRLDNPGGTGRGGLLMRSTPGGTAFIAENPAANSSMAFASKGPNSAISFDVGASPVMRLDSQAGRATLLVRSAELGAFLFAESPDPNANIVLAPKGTGAVRTDKLIFALAGVCLTADCQMRVRSSDDGTKMLLSVGSVDQASIDVSGNLRLRGSVLGGTTP